MATLFEPISYPHHLFLYINYSMLVILCSMATFWDVRENIIPNYLTYTGIIIGFLYNGILAGSYGIVSAVLAFFLLGGFFFIFFMVGGFGGGDVKLMAAVGAIAGLYMGIQCLFFTAVFGGVIALITMVKNKSKKGSIPYAIAILGGCLLTIIKISIH